MRENYSSERSELAELAKRARLNGWGPGGVEGQRPGGGQLRGQRPRGETPEILQFQKLILRVFSIHFLHLNAILKRKKYIHSHR